MGCGVPASRRDGAYPWRRFQGVRTGKEWATLRVSHSLPMPPRLRMPPPPAGPRFLPRSHITYRYRRNLSPDSPEFRHDFVGHLEVAIDVLHVVVIFKRVDEP